MTHTTNIAKALPSVELSIAATSEELEILAAAAQRKHMSLKDFLRVQLVSAAKAMAKTAPESAPKKTAKSSQNDVFVHNDGAFRPAFLP